MKQSKSLYLILIFLSIFSTPTFSQVTLTVHPRELVTYQKSYIYKNARNKLYNETMEKIKDAKHDVAQLRARLTLIHRFVYQSVTSVNGAIKQAKTLKYSANRIAHIYKDLDSIGGIAHATFLGHHAEDQEIKLSDGTSTWITVVVKDYVFLKLANEYTTLIQKRITKLQTYIKEFILEQTGDIVATQGLISNGLPIQIGGKIPNIISNVVRESFLTNIYTELYIIDVQLHSFLYKATNVHIQTEVRKLNPFADFINQDKIMMNTIKNQIRL